MPENNFIAYYVDGVWRDSIVRWRPKVFDCLGSCCIVIITSRWYIVFVVIRWFVSFFTFSFMLIQSSFSFICFVAMLTCQIFIRQEILTDIIDGIQWWGLNTRQNFVWLVIFSGTLILINRKNNTELELVFTGLSWSMLLDLSFDFNMLWFITCSANSEKANLYHIAIHMFHSDEWIDMCVIWFFQDRNLKN